MIRITVELISAVAEGRDRLLGVAEIANAGPIAPQSPYYRYEARLSKTLPGREKETWKRGPVIVEGHEVEVSQFDNVERGVWDLLYLVLKGLVGRRNP